MKTILFLVIIFLLLILGGSRYFPIKNSLQIPSLNKISNPTPTQTKKISLPKDCSGKVTNNIIEGPYYTPNSPQRQNIATEVSGRKFILEGYVFDTNCKPVARAWVDFWQADNNGDYDNSGFKLRGHQFTDSEGYYYLETIIPGEYTSRTPHIHAKVQKNENSPQIITQLYFPNQSRNENDPIFDQSTMIKIIDTNDNRGTYNFIVN